MKEEWLFPGAIVPVDMDTTAALVAEIKRLINIIGGMALAQPAPPPECKTEAEQTAYAFGWWKALESVRAGQPVQEYHRGYADAMNWKVQNHLEHLPPKEPAQELPPLTDADRRSYQKGHDAGVAHHKQAIGERNFCHRCGKRLEGVLGQPQVHTCTPPLWGHT